MRLGGMVPLNYWRKYTGENREAFGDIPLWLGDETNIRAPLRYKKNGHMILAGGIDERFNGIEVPARLMEGKPHLLMGAIEETMAERIEGDISFVTICAGRKFVYAGNSWMDEARYILRHLDHHVFGGLGYGEFADGFYNQAIVITTFTF